MPLGGIAAVVRYAAGRVLVFVFVGGVASILRVFVVGFSIFIAEVGAGGAIYPPTSLPFLPFSPFPFFPPHSSSTLNASTAIRRPWILTLRFMRYCCSMVVHLIFGWQWLHTPSTTNPMPCCERVVRMREVRDEREVGEGEAACGCKGVGASLVFTRSLHQN